MTLDELIDKYFLSFAHKGIEDEVMETIIEARGALKEFMIVTHPATNTTNLSVKDARCRAHKVLGELDGEIDLSIDSKTKEQVCIQ